MKTDSVRLTKTIHGCIFTLALLVALEDKDTTPLAAILIITVSLAALGFAEAYAHLLGTELTARKTSSLTRILEELRLMAWLILPSLPTIVILSGATASIYALQFALFGASIICCAILFGVGIWIRWQVGGSVVWSLVDGLVILSIGLVVVVLKLLAK